MQPIHALPSSAQDGEVVAVTTIDDKGDGDVAWTLYRLAYAAGGSIRATRAFKLERIPPCDGESTFNDGHHRYLVIDTNSVPILAATIVAYLGVRGQDSMTLVSEAEIRALDRSMGSGRLVSSLPTLQSIPLQRQVSDAEVVDASATWLSNRSGTSVGAALDEQSLRAVPVAPAQVRNHRRPWLVVFFTMLRHYNGRCVVPNIFITAAFVLLFRVVAIAGHSIANNEVPIQNGRASAFSSRCSVTYTTPELRPAVHVFSNCTATPTAVTQTNYTVGNESITMSTTVVDVAPFVLLSYQAQPPPFSSHLWDRIDSTHVKSNNSHVKSLVVVSFLSLASIILAMCHGESKQRAWLRVLGCSDITTLSLNLFMGFILTNVVAVAMYYLSHMASIKEWLLVSVCFTASTVCFATLWGTIAPPGTKMFGTVVLFILPLAICCFSPSGAFETTLMVLSPSVAAWYGLTQAIEPIAFHFRFSEGCIAAVLVLQAVVFGIGAHLCAAGPRLTMAAARDVLRQLSRSCCGRRSRHSRGLHRSIGDASTTHDDDDDEELDSAAPAIELREVQKGFGDHRVLNLSMTVQRGESVAVLGHNGAGKSTLLSVLMGLEKADTYSVARVFGFDVNSDIDKIRQNIGVCPQQDALFTFSSAHQNVALVAGLRGVTATDDEIEALLAYLGVPASSILMNCSAGLARRVSVACAFVGNPALVLLDEPTTGIDDASRQKIWELIAMYQRRGTTIVMTTHAMEEAEVACHRIAIVAGGDIAAAGVASELKRRYSPGYRLILDHAKRRDSRVDADGGSSSVFQEAMASALLTKLHEGATLESVVPDASHTFLLPGSSQDHSTLLHAIESNKQQLGVASYMLLDPSLDDVFVEVQRRHAHRGDAMALSSAETLATALTDLDRPEVWRAFEARAVETVSLAQDFFAQLQLMARVRQTRLRRHVLSDVTLGIVVPLLLLAVGFNLLDMTFAPLPSVCAIVTPEGSAPLAASLSNVLLAAPRPICGEFFQAVFPAGGGSRLTTLAVPRRHIGFMPEHLQAVIYVSDNFKTLGVALDKDVDPASAATFRSTVLRKVDLFVRHLRNGSAEPLPRLDIVVPGANLPTSSLDDQSRMLLRLIFIFVFGYASLAVYHLFADSVCHRVVSRSDVLGPQGCTMATATNAAMDGAISGLIFGCALAMGLLATHGITAIESASVVLGTVAFSFCMRGGSWWMCVITPLAFVTFSAMRGHNMNSDLLAALMSPTVAWSLVVMGLNGSHFNAPLAPAAILVLVHVPLCAYFLRGSFAVPVTKHTNKVARSELPSTTVQAEPDVIAEYQRVVRESDAYGRPRDAVAFCNVSFEYPAAGTLTIDSLTWGVGRGRILGFVGPNGTGKTTTLKLALKQLKPLAGGGVTYGSLGRDYDGAMLWRVVSFGVCPQDDEDMSESYTALDYMRLFVEFRLGRCVFDDKEKGGFENLDAEQWRRYAVASLQMLDIPLDVGVGSMSGGKRRLLTTALALFCGASVIVLDEPTNGVDPVTRVLMWRVIRWWTWARQRTVIMATHSMFEAERLCDTVGVLVGGSLRCIGTPSQLRAKYGTGYVAEVTINAETNVPLLDEEMKAHFGEVASKVTTRGGGLLRSYNIGAAPSMASAYQEVQTLALSCRAERVAVSRPSLQQAYRTMTR